MVLATDLFDVITALGVAAVAVVLCMFVVALAAIATAGFYYGRNTVDGRNALAAARRERRLLREMKLWQEKVLMLRGAGTLERAPETTQEIGKARRFVTPTEVASELAEKDRNSPKAPRLSAVPQIPVPEPIRGSFLEETGAAVSARS